MRLFFEDAVRVENKIVFFCRNINLLCSLGIEDGTVEIVDSMPEGLLKDQRLCGSIAEFHGDLIMVPLEARNIWIFTIKTKTWRKITLKEYACCRDKSYFRNCYLYENKLFLFGGYYPALVVVDLMKNEVDYNLSILENKNINANDLYFRGMPIEVDGRLFIASSFENSVLILDKATLHHEWKTVRKKDSRYSGIVFDGHSFWLAPRKYLPIIKWNGDSETYFDLPGGIDKSEAVYSGIVSMDDCFLISATPGSQTDSLKVDKNGKATSTEEKYILCKKLDSGDVILQTEDGKVIYQELNGQKHEYKLEIENDVFYEMLSNAGIDKKALVDGILMEGKEMDLRNWISVIKD